MSTIKQCPPERGVCYRERERCASERQACAVKCPLASLHVGAVCKGYLHHKVVASMWTLTGRGPASSFSSSLTSGIFSSRLSSSKNKSSPTTAALIKKDSKAKKWTQIRKWLNNNNCPVTTLNEHDAAKGQANIAVNSLIVSNEQNVKKTFLQKILVIFKTLYWQ